MEIAKISKPQHLNTSIYYNKYKKMEKQRQEILEILNKYKNTFYDLCEEDIDYYLEKVEEWKANERIKQQLTNSEGKDA